MKQLMKEDLLILSKLFVVENTDLIVLAKKQYGNSSGTIHTAIQLKNLLKENPLKQYTVFNLAGTTLDEFYSSSNVRAILNFNHKKNKEERCFSYINNPDNSIRWILPVTAKHPYFLNLYNSSGLRSKLIRLIFKLGWKFGMSKQLISGNFSLFSKGKVPLQKHLNSNKENWSLFTGTVGPNRKIVLELNDGNRPQYFIKIPVTSQSENLVKNENNQLEVLSQMSLQHSEVPAPSWQGKGLQLTNIKPSKSLDNIQLKSQHLIAVREWYAKSVINNQSSDTLFGGIRSNLDYIKTVDNKTNEGLKQETVKTMHSDLEKLYQELRSKSNWSTGLCHGDFTSWNMFLSENKIHVYDWEFANQNTPLLYDLFHFVFQTGVLIKRSGYSGIEWEIEQLSKHTVVQEIVQQYAIDFEQYKRYYLLHNISEYLVLYSRQEQLHKQANWLIQCWSDALSKEVMKLDLAEFTSSSKPVGSLGFE